MNLYIMVDLEGISGIYDKEQVSPSGTRYFEGRSFMTQDINACVEAAKEAGVDKVYIKDDHGPASTVIWEKLTSKLDYCISGKNPENRMPGINDCDAVILLGYHSMAGTPNGILEHTISSETNQNVWINGSKVGEIGIDSAIAGDFGKPVIMVSGDDKACGEAKALLPWVVTAEVKKAVGCFYAMLLPQEKALALLREKVKEAVRNFSNAKPHVVAKPVKLRIEKCERVQLPYSGKPFIKIIDGRTFEVEGSTVEEALYRCR